MTKPSKQRTCENCPTLAMPRERFCAACKKAYLKEQLRAAGREEKVRTAYDPGAECIGRRFLPREISQALAEAEYERKLRLGRDEPNT